MNTTIDVDHNGIAPKAFIGTKHDCIVIGDYSNGIKIWISDMQDVEDFRSALDEIAKKLMERGE